jgi:hypothetical protein
MSVSLAQLFLATMQRQSKFVFQLAKVAKLLLDVGQLLSEATLDRCAGLQVIRP